MSHIKMILGTLSCVVLFNGAFAATIPAGTQLAKVQEIVRHIKDEPSSLDPIQAVGLPEIQVARDLFEGLLNQDEKGNVIPGVAERWEQKDNVYTFHLRKDARWSNGDSVTAGDFVYSWQRLVDPKNTSSFSWFAKLAEIGMAEDILAGKASPQSLKVKAIDDHTLQVTLNHTVPYFLNLMTSFSLYPVHKATVEKNGLAWTKPENIVGNGAFRLQGRVVNEKLVLVPNEYYWDNKNTVLTKVTFIPINQESTATKRYQANDIDITESFPKNMYKRLQEILPGQVYTPDQLGTYYYAFNTQRAPLNDGRVRLALSLAIDRQIITEKVLGTGEKPAWHFTPDVTSWFKPTIGKYQAMSQSERDALAKSLIEAAGYSPEKPLHISLLYNTSENHEKIAIAVASMWKKKLGVSVKLTNQEWKTYIHSRNTGQFDVVRASWVGDYNEASTFLTLLTSSHAGNISQFKSPEYDRLLASARQLSDNNKRNDIYNHAEDIIQQQAPIAPIYQYTNSRLIKPWVKGYPINNPEDTAYSRTMYIIKH